MVTEIDGEMLRELVPVVLSILVRRGADFATAEDAVHEAVIIALTRWPDEPPRDPTAWLVTTAWHEFIDMTRSNTARRAREERVVAEPRPGRPRESTTHSRCTCCAPIRP